MNTKIRLAHGSGGKLTHQIIRDLFLPNFSNSYLEPLNDQAVIDLERLRLAFTTDSYVVDPIFFPGGDIGVLAVNGTINDLAMCGARPLFLSLGLIIEEDFPMQDLQRIVDSIKEASGKNRVAIVTGDTKVVQKGKGDKIFINTSGIGIVQGPFDISSNKARPGDIVILSGSIAEHGIAILSARERLDLDTEFLSDTASLWGLVERMLSQAEGIHSLRDPTRGGIASALNEIASSSGVCITLFEDRVPIRPQVKSICELLGLDPLYIASEGRLLAVVLPEIGEKLLEIMRSHPLGRDAAIIGQIKEAPRGSVLMKTKIGGTRIIDMMVEELLPRIC
jgi:hydrogenase expression/formation protein HypE